MQQHFVRCLLFCSSLTIRKMFSGCMKLSTPHDELATHEGQRKVATTTGWRFLIEPASMACSMTCCRK